MLEKIEDLLTKEVMKFYNTGPPDPPPSRLLYIPKRRYTRLHGKDMWEFGGDKLLEFTIPLNYIHLPENDMSPLAPTQSRLASLDNYYQAMSSFYLYLGYIHHVLISHTKLFLEGKYSQILSDFKEFSNGQSVFVFKVPLSFLDNWSRIFADKYASKFKVFSRLNLSEALKLKIGTNRIQYFTDKAMTLQMLEDSVFLSMTELQEIERNYANVIYLNFLYSLIIEGCHAN